MLITFTTGSIFVRGAALKSGSPRSFYLSSHTEVSKTFCTCKKFGVYHMWSDRGLCYNYKHQPSTPRACWKQIMFSKSRFYICVLLVFTLNHNQKNCASNPYQSVTVHSNSWNGCSNSITTFWKIGSFFMDIKQYFQNYFDVNFLSVYHVWRRNTDWSVYLSI